MEIERCNIDSFVLVIEEPFTKTVLLLVGVWELCTLNLIIWEIQGKTTERGKSASTEGDILLGIEVSDDRSAGVVSS